MDASRNAASLETLVAEVRQAFEALAKGFESLGTGATSIERVDPRREDERLERPALTVALIETDPGATRELLDAVLGRRASKTTGARGPIAAHVRVRGGERFGYRLTRGTQVDEFSALFADRTGELEAAVRGAEGDKQAHGDAVQLLDKAAQDMTGTAEAAEGAFAQASREAAAATDRETEAREALQREQAHAREVDDRIEEHERALPGILRGTPAWWAPWLWAWWAVARVLFGRRRRAGAGLLEAQTGAALRLQSAQDAYAVAAASVQEALQERDRTQARGRDARVGLRGLTEELERTKGAFEAVDQRLELARRRVEAHREQLRLWFLEGTQAALEDPSVTALDVTVPRPDLDRLVLLHVPAIAAPNAATRHRSLEQVRTEADGCLLLGGGQPSGEVRRALLSWFAHLLATPGFEDTSKQLLRLDVSGEPGGLFPLSRVLWHERVAGAAKRAHAALRQLEAELCGRAEEVELDRQRRLAELERERIADEDAFVHVELARARGIVAGRALIGVRHASAELSRRLRAVRQEWELRIARTEGVDQVRAQVAALAAETPETLGGVQHDVQAALFSELAGGVRDLCGPLQQSLAGRYERVERRPLASTPPARPTHGEDDLGPVHEAILTAFRSLEGDAKTAFAGRLLLPTTGSALGTWLESLLRSPESLRRESIAHLGEELGRLEAQTKDELLRAEPRSARLLEDVLEQSLRLAVAAYRNWIDEVIEAERRELDRQREQMDPLRALGDDLGARAVRLERSIEAVRLSTRNLAGILPDGAPTRRLHPVGWGAAPRAALRTSQDSDLSPIG